MDDAALALALLRRIAEASQYADTYSRVDGYGDSWDWSAEFDYMSITAEEADLLRRLVAVAVG